MIYLLDTSIISAFMRRRPELHRHTAAINTTDEVVISVVTRGEIRFGLSRLPEGARRRRLEAEAATLLRHLSSVPVNDAIAEQYAVCKRDAQRTGTPLADNDLWIAATALELGAVLVTADSDFSNPRGLTLADWTK